MMKQIICAIVIAIIWGGNPDEVKEANIKRDNSLIAPGIGAESIILNEGADSFILRIGHPDRALTFKKPKELFRDIFHLQSPVKIHFTRLFYFHKKQFIVFLKKDYAVAIAGFKRSRSDHNSVNLAKGADYFLFSYGNSNLHVLDNKQGSRIYLYPKFGIAIADDKLDDLIDIYIIFPAQKVDSNNDMATDIQ